MEQTTTIYLTKAIESLLTAESEFANGRYNSCANRSYYACFQAAIAAILNEGIRPSGQWNHQFVQAQFVGVLINKRKRYESELRRVLADNQSLRDKADYRPEFVTATQASRALRRTRLFVTAIRQRGGVAQ
ncbi:MAG TPA: HEPN domain-containing protein [Pyrinomonadaceae bacterium]|nr:HEPN domain-containing protein [Pyrinomonadaceae bacterium]